MTLTLVYADCNGLIGLSMELHFNAGLELI